MCAGTQSTASQAPQIASTAHHQESVWTHKMVVSAQTLFVLKIDSSHHPNFQSPSGHTMFLSAKVCNTQYSARSIQAHTLFVPDNDPSFTPNPLLIIPKYRCQSRYTLSLSTNTSILLRSEDLPSSHSQSFSVNE